MKKRNLLQITPKIIIISLLIAVLVLGGCQQSSKETNSAVQVISTSKNLKKDTAILDITQEFGSTVIQHKADKIQIGQSVMSLLEASIELDLSYDGGFVQSIKGIRSQKSTVNSKAKDWFYYVNGVLSDSGAADYTLNAEDAVWWDFHEWGGESFTPAVIGQYPEPFKNGFRENNGAHILFAPTAQGENAAKTIKTALKELGVDKVILEVFSDDVFLNRTMPCIVVGEWESLSSFETLKGMNKHVSKTGANVVFKTDGVELLNAFGEVKAFRKSETGVIVATGTGMGDKASAWLVIGTDEVGLKSAATLLTESPESLNMKVGVAVTGKKITALPIGK